MDNQFSIIITTYNDEKKVNDFFSSVKSQSIQPNYIIVVDGGSKDNTVQEIRKIQSKMIVSTFIIVDEYKRLNISQGFNEGIRHCPTEKIFLMGVGNTYPQNFFEEMLLTMNTTKSDIIQCILKGIDATPFAKAFNTAFLKTKGLKPANRGVLINKAVFEKIGGFYENFIYAGEDAEFFIRTKKRSIASSRTENTYVNWDTPINFKEYMKKNQVNAIADIQWLPWSKLFINIISRIAIIIFTIIFTIIFCKTVYPYLLLILLVAFIIYKIKSFNLKAILLRLHFMFLPAYLYLKNIKLFKKKYIVYSSDVPKI